jgi:hypothetical protein
MARTITLHLDGENISAQVFHQKVGAFLALLRDIDKSVTDDLDATPATGPSLRWVVQSIRAGSPVDMTLRAEPLADDVGPQIADRIIATVVIGLTEIASRPVLDEPPTYFTFPALEDVRDLVKTGQDGVTGVVVSTPEQTVPLSEHTKANLDRFLRTAFEHDGSVEGVLQTVSVAGGKPRITLYNRLSGRAINCAVPRERIPEVLRVFDRRVSVFGRVRTNELGDVIGIHLERIEAFPNDDELPSVEQVAGAFDLTGGKSVSEHLDRLRDAS